MKTIEKFDRTIIEALHGIEYGEAVRVESNIDVIMGKCNECGGMLSETGRIESFCGKCESFIFVKESIKYKPLPIDISRVMKALENKGVFDDEFTSGKVWGSYGATADYIKLEVLKMWQWVKKDGYTKATLDDQDPKTLEKILELFQK